VATRVYIARQQYDKAEPYLPRAEHLDESLYGADSPGIMMPLSTPCNLYDKWGKPDKAEPCYTHALSIGEKQFRADNPQIVRVLTADADQLRKLGKTDDADKLEKRAASLQSATMTPN
jgi:tetratricopeptide (TPR) repeat protein